ncbi:unnamed protein product [Ceutorhynchus assimilis]|uniref:Regulatory protein zeste n=1 Tax=Ceutorhynchus assimilis TaxID=467358 RepID=A0A9P0DTQ6_9CUCU|nr:unnamed protein product [Ceutorhynchus assimilis]
MRTLAKENSALNRSNSFTFKDAQKQWQEITSNLNSVAKGSKKDWKQWRKTWTDIKKNTKSRAAENRKHCMKTGGGPPLKFMDERDNEVLNIIGTVSQEGHRSVKETNVDFTFQETDDVDNEDEILGRQCHTLLVQVDDIQVMDSQMTDDINGDIMKQKKQEQSGIVEPLDEIPEKSINYENERSSKKLRMSKTKKFESSYKMNKDFLNVVDQRKNMEQTYYEAKIEFMEERKKYFKKKTQIMKEGVEVLRDIRNILLSSSEQDLAGE